MTIDEIQAEWKKDSTIDETQISTESIKGSSLHYKYTNYQIKANKLYAVKKSEYNKLVRQKIDYYLDGPKKLSEVKDITKVVTRKVLVKDVDKYIMADDDVIKVSLELSELEDLCDTIKSILTTISKRSFDLKNYIDYLKFSNGQ